MNDFVKHELYLNLLFFALQGANACISIIAPLEFEKLGYSQDDMGIIIAAQPFSMAMACIFYGQVRSALGHSKVALLSIAMVTLGYFIFGFSLSLGL